MRHKVDVLHGHCEAVDRDSAEVEVTHLTNALVAPDRSLLRDRIEAIRDRNMSAEEFSRRNNAGTAEDHMDLFSAYSVAGASHSIVSMPDVHIEGSIEAFAEIITNLSES